MWMEMFLNDREKSVPGTPANLKHLFSHNGVTKDCKNYYDCYNLCELVVRTNVVSLASIMLREKPVSTEEEFRELVDTLFAQINLFGRFSSGEQEGSEDESEPMEVEEDTLSDVEDKINDIEQEIEEVTKEREILSKEVMDVEQEQDQEQEQQYGFLLYEKEQYLASQRDDLVVEWLERTGRDKCAGQAEEEEDQELTRTLGNRM